MSEQDNSDRVWNIIEKVEICMLTTRFSGGLRARPIEARPDRLAGLIVFVTDVHSVKEDEIEAAPDVGLTVIDLKDKAYLSITGRARVTRDAAKTKEVWRKTDEFWWPGGPADAHVSLLRARVLFGFFSGPPDCHSGRDRRTCLWTGRGARGSRRTAAGSSRRFWSGSGQCHAGGGQ
jgi:general stress protein 26